MVYIHLYIYQVVPPKLPRTFFECRTIVIIKIPSLNKDVRVCKIVMQHITLPWKACAPKIHKEVSRSLIIRACVRLVQGTVTHSQ